MFLYIILLLISCIAEPSSATVDRTASPLSSHSSSDSDIIVESITQLFTDPNDNIRRYASQIVIEDISSPIRTTDFSTERVTNFSLDNEQDRDYAHRVALRVSEMIMDDLRNKADERWTKKRVAVASSISSVVSAAIVLVITLTKKE